MKAVYKIFLAALMLQGILFGQWSQQSSGVIYALKSVHFTGVNTGFACGYNLVLKTTNSGVNWQNNFLHGNHNGITFTDNNTGYVCSDSGKIFKTTNAGNNWIPQASGVTSNLTALSFLNSQTGIVTGYGKTILKTTNGGDSWFNTANFIWQIDLLGCKIVNSSTYYTSGTESFIMKTTDGGASWKEHTHGEVNPLFTIDFINEQTGWATGCCGMFVTTTNGGDEWVMNGYLTLGFTIYALKFINESTGYAVGANGGIYRTTNGGAWWDSTVTHTDENIYSICMLNENTGWAVGGYGIIYKTTNGGGTGHTIGINQVSTEVPSEFKLYQNYPNPFNPETKIKFQVPKEGIVELKIYDVLGSEVETIVNDQFTPGTYEVSFNASKYPSGIYFYMLQYGNTIQSNKMMLIK